MNSGGTLLSGSAAEKNSGLRASAVRISSPSCRAERRELGQLAVAFDQRALLADRGLAVGPFGGVEQAAAFRHLLEGQDLRHMDHHAAGCSHTSPSER